MFQSHTLCWPYIHLSETFLKHVLFKNSSAPTVQLLNPLLNTMVLEWMSAVTKARERTQTPELFRPILPVVFENIKHDLRI